MSYENRDSFISSSNRDAFYLILFFSFLMVTFDEQKILILIKSNFSIFFFYLYFMTYLRIFAYTKVFNIFYFFCRSFILLTFKIIDPAQISFFSYWKDVKSKLRFSPEISSCSKYKTIHFIFNNFLYYNLF